MARARGSAPAARSAPRAGKAPCNASSSQPRQATERRSCRPDRSVNAREWPGLRAAKDVDEGFLPSEKPDSAFNYGMRPTGSFRKAVKCGRGSEIGGRKGSPHSAALTIDGAVDGLGASAIVRPNPKLSGSGNPNFGGKQSSHFPIHPSTTTPEVCLDDLALNREAFLVNHALICRFTKRWPNLCDLRACVSEKWKEYMRGEISIYLCGNGFFILEFDSQRDKELILECSPWFFQEDFVCMKPWFPEFDPRTEIFATAFLWVRLRYLPIQFWELECLRAIGNSLGRYHRTSEETRDHQNSTCARICVEMDLLNGLPAEILLKVGNRYKRQPIDYEKIPWFLGNAPKEVKPPRL